jgi:hypothetical protein
MHRQIKRIDLVQMRGDIANDFELDFGGALGFAKLPPQTLARAITQMREVIVEVAKVQRQPRHRHARNAGETVPGKSGESVAVLRGKILQNDQ